MEKKYCVLSHTHWDREWYMPFENFRIKLAALINNLFKIIEKYPSYIFHLDAQTIVLEDYLSIYPENKEILKRYIKSGNIVVGPWYVQNDFFLSSAEATVRNLLIGHKIAETFGRCAMVGYTPDQFGLPSQLPQILKQFGIRYNLFGRGYAFYDENGDKIPVPAEAYWESPDGSRVFSVLMPFWYNNAQRITSDTDRAIDRLHKAKDDFAAWSRSSDYLLMNGVDHLEAQDDLIPVMEKINEKLSGEKIVQVNMEEYLKDAEKYADENVRKGELRYGGNGDILTGTFSTRPDIKKMNFDAQNMIEHVIEPLYSMLYLAGAEHEYPKNFIDYMWKLLIPNHAHDSICCCSDKNVMKHMADRYMSINEIGDDLINRGSRFLNHHISRDEKDSGAYFLTVINTSQNAYTGVVRAELDFLRKDCVTDFVIKDPEGNEAEYYIESREETCRAAFSPLNLPGNVDVVRYKIQMYVRDVPAFGYTNYTVRPGSGTGVSKNGALLENEYLKVSLDGGRINIFNKENHTLYENVLTFEDVGDSGSSYIFAAVPGDIPVQARFKAREAQKRSPFKSEVKLYYELDIPRDTFKEKRSGEKETCGLRAVLSLSKGDRHLNIDVEIDNKCKAHLIRACIDGGIKNTVTYASSVYDIIRRDLKDVRTDVINPTQPVNGFVYQADGNRGLAVFTKGLYEYESRTDGKILLSLLRSVETISDRWSKNDLRHWSADDIMIGKVCVSFAIMPFSKGAERLAAMEQRVCIEPVVYFDSVDIHAFNGGRPAVQDTEIDELYFPADEYESLYLPHRAQFADISDRVCVTALKKAENGDGIVMRFYNPYDSTVDTGIKGAHKTNIREEDMKNFDGQAKAKEIVSLFIENR